MCFPDNVVAFLLVLLEPKGVDAGSVSPGVEEASGLYRVRADSTRKKHSSPDRLNETAHKHRKEVGGETGPTSISGAVA